MYLFAFAFRTAGGGGASGLSPHDTSAENSDCEVLCFAGARCFHGIDLSFLRGMAISDLIGIATFFEHIACGMMDGLCKDKWQAGASEPCHCVASCQAPVVNLNAHEHRNILELFVFWSSGRRGLPLLFLRVARPVTHILHRAS